MIEALFEFTARVVVEFAFYTVFYGIGRVMLRLVTFGRYPPGRAVKHNRDFVAVMPIVATLVVLTLAYS